MPRTVSLTKKDFTVGWICALDVELRAALAVLDEVLPEPPFQRLRGDPGSYQFGRIKEHYVVVASLPARYIGTVPAATVALYMQQSFPNLRFGLMVGVGGGAPNLQKGHDIRLGDVVISEPKGRRPAVVQYDYGQAMENGKFVPMGTLEPPPTVLLNALSVIKTRNNSVNLEKNIRERAWQIGAENPGFQHPQSPDYLFPASYFHVPDEASGGGANCRRCDFTRAIARPRRETDHPHFHYGTIASGNQVMKDGVKRDMIGAQTGALCFEMEAAGLMDNFPCLVIRGICDYSDGHKHKSWQPYAALVAALYARELLLCC